MKTFLILFAVIVVTTSGLEYKNGEKNVRIGIGHPFGEVIGVTKKLKNGQTQVWNLSGPDKGTWVDSKGKKIPSSNYAFEPPGGFLFKKISKADEGSYELIIAPSNATAPPEDYIVSEEINGVYINVE